MQLQIQSQDTNEDIMQVMIIYIKVTTWFNEERNIFLQRVKLKSTEKNI